MKLSHCNKKHVKHETVHPFPAESSAESLELHSTLIQLEDAVLCSCDRAQCYCVLSVMQLYQDLATAGTVGKMARI